VMMHKVADESLVALQDMELGPLGKMFGFCFRMVVVLHKRGGRKFATLIPALQSRYEALHKMHLRFRKKG